jgi:hypothetical protein
MKTSIQAAVVDVDPWGDDLWLPTLVHGVGLYASQMNPKTQFAQRKIKNERRHQSYYPKRLVSLFATNLR